MKYFFEFGVSHKLASLELASFLTASKTKHKKLLVLKSGIVISTKKLIQPEQTINRLGGTVRIALFSSQVQTKSQLASSITKLLSGQSSKQTFSIAFPNSNPISSLPSTVKSSLSKRGIKSRFINPQDIFVRPITITDKKITELVIVKSKSSYLVFKTTVVSDTLAWQNRDRNRPATDPKSGMLAPKIARMMINIALPTSTNDQTKILDPFCGSGTILSEAVLLGLQAYGSDISKTAICNSLQNIHWLEKDTQNKFSINLIQADARKLTTNSFNTQFDLVVTEGYLGPPKFHPNKLEAIISQLDSLYGQVLLNLLPLLKPKAKLVIALPKHNHPNSVKSLSHLIDTCENNGYTRLAGPVIYSKPKSRVQRAIYLLQKN